MSNRKLRIAQIAPITERVPPKKYGGTERVVNLITEGLVKRGHDVTLFATGDSLTSAKISNTADRALREVKIRDIYGSNEFTLLHIGSAYSMQNEFDIIHDHLVPLSLPTANMAATPVVCTMHGDFTLYNRNLFKTMTAPKIVTISNSQAKKISGINHVGTIYHGIDVKAFPFSSKNDGYLLYVGRICMDKGTHLAIEVSQYTGIPLVIAAKVDAVDRKYFKEFIEPELSNGQIKWIGEVDDVQRNRLMSRALCLLHPVLWDEPFGLAMIEAMACGCPVVAFNRGSVSEIVEDAKTGYVVSTLEQMIDDVYAIDRIKRQDCRKHVEENFNADDMVSAYEKLYLDILSENEPAFTGRRILEDSERLLFPSPGQQNFFKNGQAFEIQINARRGGDS